MGKFGEISYERDKIKFILTTRVNLNNKSNLGGIFDYFSFLICYLIHIYCSSLYISVDILPRLNTLAAIRLLLQNKCH